MHGLLCSVSCNQNIISFPKDLPFQLSDQRWSCYDLSSTSYANVCMYSLIFCDLVRWKRENQEKRDSFFVLTQHSAYVLSFSLSLSLIIHAWPGSRIAYFWLCKLGHGYMAPSNPVTFAPKASGPETFFKVIFVLCLEWPSLRRWATSWDGGSSLTISLCPDYVTE